MKKSIITILATILLLSAMWINSSYNAKESQFDVTVVKPENKSIYDYVNANGRVYEGNKRDIYTRSISRVEAVKVKEGQTVSKGDVIVRLSRISIESKTDTETLYDMSNFKNLFLEYYADLTGGINIEDIIDISDETVIRSPIDGIITEINVSEGENTNPLNKIASVSDFSELYITAMIPETYSLRVREGAEAEISGDAFGENVKYMGKVKKVSLKTTYIPSITGNGKTYTKAFIELNTKNKLFRPGLNVNAKITIDTLSNALTLPYECIHQDEENKEYVFLIKDNTVKKQMIKTGYELDNEVEIKSGVEDNSVVVFKAPEGLYNGAKVNIIKPE